MVLYNLGIAAIAPQSETQFIEENVLEDLRKRFKHIVLLFDNDQTGIEFTNKIYFSFQVITCLYPSYNFSDSHILRDIFRH